MEKLNLNLRQKSPLKFGNVTAPFAKCMIMITFLSSTRTLKLLKAMNGSPSTPLALKKQSIYFVKNAV